MASTKIVNLRSRLMATRHRLVPTMSPNDSAQPSLSCVAPTASATLAPNKTPLKVQMGVDMDIPSVRVPISSYETEGADLEHNRTGAAR